MLFVLSFNKETVLKRKNMFVNVKNYNKMLKISLSCITKDHVEVTFKMALKFRRTARLTEFEYMEIEKILIQKLGLKIETRWNGNINLNELLEKSTIQ